MIPGSIDSIQKASLPNAMLAITSNLTSATGTKDISVHQTERSRPPSHVVPDTSRSSHRSANFIPHIQKLQASARFHPSHPEYLHVGYRRSDGTDVWLSVPPLPILQLQRFHDHEGNKVLGEGPESSFDWLDEYKPQNFEGPTTAQKEMDRHIKLQHMMNANRVKNNPMKPVLVVSASNQPNDAPSHVYLREDWAIADLFSTLVNDCKPRVRQGETLRFIETRFLWDGRKQRLRENNPDDWAIFWEALRRAWRQKRSYFLENGCEIEMVLRVEEGG